MISVNLDEAIKNPDKAPALIKQVQNSFDELLDVMDTQKAELQRTAADMKEARSHMELLQRTNFDLLATLKHIHIMLQNRKDLFVGDNDMKKVMDELAKLILSSGAIKIGVLTNEESKPN